MTEFVTTLLALVKHQADQARADDGASAIEWVIFGVLAVTVAGLVAAAITLAVNNKLPGIK